MWFHSSADISIDPNIYRYQAHWVAMHVWPETIRLIASNRIIAIHRLARGHRIVWLSRFVLDRRCECY